MTLEESTCTKQWGAAKHEVDTPKSKSEIGCVIKC